MQNCARGKRHAPRLYQSGLHGFRMTASEAKMKQQFLDVYDEEHARTMRVLRAYPEDKLDLQPHPKLKTARELAWVFVLERYLGTAVWHDEYAKGRTVSGKPPVAPDGWNELLATLEKSSKDFRALIESASDDTLHENVHFFK